MKILVMSQAIFNKEMRNREINDTNVEAQTELAFISIQNPFGDPEGYEPHFKENHENVLNVSFFDLDEPVEEFDPETGGLTSRYMPISEEQANQIYQFVKKNKDKKGILVHCTAGVSRSGAVGAFIHDFTTRGAADWEEFKRLNGQIQPNATVYRLLQKAWYDDHSQF